jgi:hypothetical protein
VPGRVEVAPGELRPLKGRLPDAPAEVFRVEMGSTRVRKYERAPARHQPLFFERLPDRRQDVDVPVRRGHLERLTLPLALPDFDHAAF